ncbi:hypothetical protein ACPXCG_17335 [Gordonia sp. DT218]|uniref:hypothetical protein n=1 Tax=Gordonia sp. DT218 TaxID=3416659 RepID=UPI003CE885CD
MSLVGAGSAAARPYEAPRITQYSDDIWAIGANSSCRGAIHVGLKVDPAQPGKVFVTYTPRGFVGDGAGWKRNPVCVINTNVIIDYFRQSPSWHKTVTAGPRGGKPVKLTLNSGSGLHVLAFGGIGASWGNGSYLIVP